jgi:parallel beta-helix repeat protein
MTVAYNSVDCTANLQAALNGTADTIVIPNTGSPWVTGRLILSRSNVTLRLEPGVELLANLNAFSNSNHSLLELRWCKNVTISGYGATFRMLNGTDPAYANGEGRHCLSLRAVDKVLIEGLTFTKAGGDGIYMRDGFGGADPLCSSNVTIQDCVMDDNRRQGISVVSAENLLIQRCILSNTGVTSGAAPMAGIDFEPDRPDQRIVNCILRDCSIYGNNGAKDNNGIHTYLLNLNAASRPVFIAIERCRITSTRVASSPVGLTGTNSGGPLTTLTMTDCLIEDTRGSGLYIKSAASATTVRLIRTVLRNTHTDAASWGGTPIYLEGQLKEIAAYGNITFTDCLVVDGKPRPFMRTYESRAYFSPPLASGYFDGIRGNITVVNPNAAGRVWNLDYANDRNITLAVTGLAAMPVQTVGAATTASSSIREGDTGILQVSRTATNRAFPLAVDLAWSGTAANRIDYGCHPGFVMLPPNATTANVSLSARADNLVEIQESAVLGFAPRPGDYSVATGVPSATLLISD